MGKKLRFVELRKGTAATGWRIEEYNKRTKKWIIYEDDYGDYEWDADSYDYDDPRVAAMETWQKLTNPEEAVVLHEAEVA